MVYLTFMGKSLILLHGALGSAEQLVHIKNSLGLHFTCFTFDFMGHGGTSIPDKILMPNLVNQLESFIKENIPAEDHLTVFGYSMGGYAALMLASRRLSKIDRIITLGTKLAWSPDIAMKEVKMLNPNVIEEKVPAFAKELENRHQPQDWKLLLSKTIDMMTDLGVNQYLNDEVLNNISVPVKLMIGDRDKMSSLDETVDVFRKLKDVSISVLPSTPHPIDKVNMNRLIFELLEK